MKEAHEDGTPVMRTLFYEFPEDDKTWEVDNTYMLGDEILVAPIMNYKDRSRKVYLPKGHISFFNSTIFYRYFSYFIINIKYP